MAHKKINHRYGSVVFHLLYILPALASSNNCELDVHRDLNNSDVLPLTNKKPPEFVYPSIDSRIELKNGDTIRLECGSHSQLFNCKKSTTTIKHQGCEQSPKFIGRRTKKATCPSNVECYAIGYPVSLSDFVTTIDLIYMNPGRMRPLWAHAKILPIIGNRQKHNDDDNDYNEQYESCDIFDDINVNMEQVYTKDYQRRRFSKLLGDQRLAAKYISDEGVTIFQPGGDALARGLLIDEKNFFYRSQQSTTHHYANVMPIWKSVANGNWRESADIVRKIAGAYNKNGVDLWSGAIGTFVLQDVNGVKHDIYLADDDASNGVIPIPKLLYKYVYDRKTDRGIVIITVNDPFVRKLNKNEHLLCNEQNYCHRVYPRLKIYALGYTYCCTLKDFSVIAKKRGLPIFSTAKSLF